MSHVLVVGTGNRHYREALFRSLADAGIWLLTAEEPSWELRYVAGYTVTPRLSAAKVSLRTDPVLDLVMQLARDHEINGVLTFEELLTPLTAQIAEALDLPTFATEAVENCRDKLRTRELLRSAGLPQPVSEFALNDREAAAVAEHIGYPLIVKPRGMAGSIGVVRVENPYELTKTFDVARRAAREGAQRHGGGALVETMIEGEEVSIDCLVFAGEVEVLFVARTRFGPPPYFEETGKSVRADDPLLANDEVIETLRRAHAALGVRNGMTHTELKLTPDGPVIIEVNARIGGDFIPHTAELATGIAVGVVAAQVARGVRPRIPRHIARAASNEIIYPPMSGIVRNVVVPPASPTTGVVQSGVLVELGQVVRLPPEAYMMRCAFVIVAGNSEDECAVALNQAVAACSVEVDATVLPLPTE